MRYFRKHGVVLGCLRLPFRLGRKIVNFISTSYWRFFLGNMGKGCVIEFGVHFENPKLISLGNRVWIKQGCYFVSENLDGKLNVEDDVQINENVRLDHTGGVSIGKGSLISESVVIYSHSHGFDPRSAPVPIPKVLGKNVWLGAGCMILESVEFVGDSCIVGASTVLTKSTSSNEVWVGPSSRSIKK